MRKYLALLTLALCVSACDSAPPSLPFEQPSTQAIADQSLADSHTSSINSQHLPESRDSDDNRQGGVDSQCHPALEPLRQALPVSDQMEGQPLRHQTCGMNLVTKVYGPLDESAPGATISYSIHSYTRQYADLSGLGTLEADAFLAQQRQGWLAFLDNLREKVRWAETADIYTDEQLARLPQEFLWQDSMPAVLDNGTGIWALTIWLTADVAANVSVHDETNPDPTAEEALQRLTPLASALNFQPL